MSARPEPCAGEAQRTLVASSPQNAGSPALQAKSGRGAAPCRTAPSMAGLTAGSQRTNRKEGFACRELLTGDSAWLSYRRRAAAVPPYRPAAFTKVGRGAAPCRTPAPMAGSFSRTRVRPSACSRRRAAAVWPSGRAGSCGAPEGDRECVISRLLAPEDDWLHICVCASNRDKFIIACQSVVLMSQEGAPSGLDGR